MHGQLVWGLRLRANWSRLRLPYRGDLEGAFA